MVENRGIKMEEKEKKQISSEEIVKIALDLIEESKKEGITLRLIGGPAVRIHSSPMAIELHKKLKRIEGQEFPDIDFVAPDKERAKIRKFFETRGWKFDSYIFFFTSGVGTRNRQVYRGKVDLDIFYDELDLCHKIDFRNRFNIDFPTASLVDLLLTKLEIVEFTEKDAKDVIVLIRDHKIGDNDAPETINAKYMAKLFANDWGFWYTATNNLKKVRAACPMYKQLSEEDITDVTSKIDQILKCIDEEPKTKEWLKRAEVGTKKKWYKEVRL
ncbi:MAG: hypothetical protein QXZ02_01235 [Candidatus Bathyarchaeia archaeon]